MVMEKTGHRPDARPSGDPRYGNVNLEELRKDTYEVLRDLGKASMNVDKVFKELLEKAGKLRDELEHQARALPEGGMFEPLIRIVDKLIMLVEEGVTDTEAGFAKMEEPLKGLMKLDVFNTERVLANYELLHWADFVNRVLLYVLRAGPVTREKVANHFGEVKGEKIDEALGCLLDSGSITKSKKKDNVGHNAGEEYEVMEKGTEAVLKVLGLQRWSETISTELDRLNLLSYMGWALGRDDLAFDPTYFLAVLPLVRAAYHDGGQAVTAEEIAYELGERYSGHKRPEAVEKILEGMAAYGIVVKKQKTEAKEAREEYEYVLDTVAYYNPIDHGLKKRR